MRYDAVVVGSGIGGMTAAITLAKERRRTLVLEQHERPGGLMSVFRRGECRFPTGVHSVGSLAEGQVLWRYLKYLGVLDRVRPVPLDDDGIMEYVFPGTSFVVPRGHEAFRARLIDSFPSERAGIERFFADMRQVASQFPLYRLDSGVERPSPGARAQSLASYLDELTGSRLLKGVLSGLNVFYGVDPAECPLYVHFLVMDSFVSSSWRFDEARAPLADAFLAAFRAAGGEVRCGARVAAVEATNRTVSAVRLTDGERIESDVVVFTGHPRLLPALCEGGGLRPAYKERLIEQPETPGMFGIALAWEHPECSLPGRDVVIYGGLDTGRHYHQRGVLDGETPDAIIAVGSRNPGSRTCSAVIMALVPCEDWTPWWDSRTGHRAASYTAAKQGLAGRILGVLRGRWPQAAGGMRLLDSFSPLTFRDYTMTPTASAYGLRKSVGAGRSGRIITATRIRGLFLAGQNVVISGVVGTVISGIDACAAILGRRHLIEQIARATRS